MIANLFCLTGTLKCKADTGYLDQYGPAGGVFFVAF